MRSKHESEEKREKKAEEARSSIRMTGKTSARRSRATRNSVLRTKQGPMGRSEQGRTVYSIEYLDHTELTGSLGKEHRKRVKIEKDIPKYMFLRVSGLMTI